MRERNPEGINTGNPLARTFCPVSLDRLRELYCEELKTCVEIGKLLYVSKSVVQNWLKQSGIPLRTVGQAKRIWIQRNPLAHQKMSIMATQVAKDSEKRKQGVRDFWSSSYGKKTLRKSRKAGIAAAKKREVVCACAYCDTPKSMPKWKAEKFKYCSRDCYFKAKRLAKLAAPIQSYQAKQEQQARKQFEEWGLPYPSEK